MQTRTDTAIGNTSPFHHRQSSLLLTALVVVFAFFASCIDERVVPEEVREAVTFSASKPSVMGMDLGLGLGMRASNETWNAGDAIGIFMLNAGEQLGISTSITGNAYNRKYITTDGHSWNAYDDSQTIFYPQSGNVDFIAYHPHANVSDYMYAVELANQQYPEVFDVLYSDNATNISRSAAAVNLEFKHALSKIELNVKAGSDLTAADLQGMSVLLSGMPTKADLSLADGSFSNLSGTATTIVPRSIITDVDVDASFEAIVIPQDAHSLPGRDMIFTLTNGDTYIYPLPDTDIIAQGKNHTYFITILKKEIVVSSAIITDWTADAPLDGGRALELPKMEPIAAGSFRMGSSNGSNVGNADGSGLNITPSENSRSNDETQHWVTLTSNFSMGRYPVTNLQYALFLNDQGVGGGGSGMVTYANGGGQSVTNVQLFVSTPNNGLVWSSSSGWVSKSGYHNHPVVSVTWYGAKAYADWMGGSLPTEAQWEYACRAGSESAYYFGNDVSMLDFYSWNHWNANSTTHAVGQKPPNDFGLYDMHGNVWEWCADWFSSNYYNNSIVNVDPTGPASGTQRVIRGGAFSSLGATIRSAYRGTKYPHTDDSRTGFRIVRINN